MTTAVTPPSFGTITTQDGAPNRLADVHWGRGAPQLGRSSLNCWPFCDAGILMCVYLDAGEPLLAYAAAVELRGRQPDILCFELKPVTERELFLQKGADGIARSAPLELRRLIPAGDSHHDGDSGSTARQETWGSLRRLAAPYSWVLLASCLTRCFRNSPRRSSRLMTTCLRRPPTGLCEQIWS